MNRPSSQIEADLNAVTELLASRGWAVLAEAIEGDIRNASLAMAKSPTMTTEEVHYRRGAIFAASAASGLPHRLRQILENDLLIARSHEAPAKAGVKG